MPTPPIEPPDSRDGPLGGKPPVRGDVAGTPLRAVLVGLVIDYVGTELVGIVLVTLYQASLANAGLNDDQIRSAVADIDAASTVGVLFIVLGLLCSVAGGYACARIVLRDEYRVGAVMATISSLGAAAGGGPVDLQLLDTITVFACVMLGVMYGERRNRRAAPSPAPPPGGSPP